ncbi:MAG: hypothetical protein AAB759_00300 [Patescibacteria group bacterium]
MATATLFMHHSGPLTVCLRVNGEAHVSRQNPGQDAPLIDYVLAAARAVLCIHTKRRQWALLEFSPEEEFLKAARVAE